MFSFLKTNIKIIAFIAGITLLLTASGQASADTEYKGIVNSFKLNIRKSPSRKSDVLAVVKQGEKINVHKIMGGTGGWLLVDYKGIKGYVRNRPRYIRLIRTRRSRPKKHDTAQKKKLREKIQAQEKIVETFSKKEREIIDGLNEIDYTLNRTRLKALSLSSEIRHMEKQISSLGAARRKLSEEIAQNRSYAAKRLKALYKMNMMGRLDAAGLPKSIFDFFLRQNSMKRIIRYDFHILEKQGSDLKKLEILEQELKAQIKAKTALEAELNDQIRMNKKETLKKELILTQIRRQKKLSLAALESLKEAAIRLDNQIAGLQKEDNSSSPGFSFASHKGRLILPVKGKIISRFGPLRNGNYKSFTFQKGIDIRVERGEPVKSVFRGKVMFARWLKGYGNMLIINHGNSYYTLYAHVEEIFKQKGETVETGEVIATAGDTGSIKGPCLHFEVRHHGKPENPMKWLSKGA